MISKLSQQAWDKKVIELGGSILQSWQWGEFHKSLGFEVVRFSADDFINQAVTTPLAAGKKYLYCARGPLGNVSEAISDLKKFAQQDHNIVFARLEPQQAIDLPRALKDIQPTNNWVLDLNQTEEEILINMKPKTRYNINLAQRKGITVRQGGKQDLIEAYKLLMETAGRGNFRLHPQNYYWQAYEILSPDYLKLLIAEYNNKPLACMILTLFGSTATYMHGGSSTQMKEAMAPYLLHWEAIKLAKKLGFANYDFGGVAPEGAKDHSWSGISRFKKGFGGFEVVYPGSFELIFAPLWYNVYKNTRTLRNLIKRK